MLFQNNVGGQRTVPSRPLRALCLTLLALCLTGAPAAQAQTFVVNANEIDVSTLKGNETDPAIAINPLNPANLFVASSTDANFPGLYVAWSLNSGASWTNYYALSTNIVNTTNITITTNRVIANGNDSLTPAYGEASVAWDAYGNLFVAYQPATFEGVAVAVSTNGGVNFTAVTNLAPFDATDLPKITSPPSGAGVGSVWLVYKDYTLANTPLVAQGLQTTGLGNIGGFGTPQNIPSSADGGFADISVGPAGQVMVAFQDNTTNSAQSHIFTTVNTNAFGGGAFSRVVTATANAVGGFTYITAERTGIGVNAAAGLAWNMDAYSSFYGKAFLIYTGRSGVSNNLEIDFRSSTDNGASWSGQSQINDNSVNDHFFPRIAADPITGIIAASWYDCRNDQGPNSVQITNITMSTVTISAMTVTNFSVANADNNLTVNVTSNSTQTSFTVGVLGNNISNFALANISGLSTSTSTNSWNSTTNFDNGNLAVTVDADTNGGSVSITVIETNVFPEAFTRGTADEAPIPYCTVSLNGGASFVTNLPLSVFTQPINAPAQGFVSSTSGSTSTTGFGHYTGLAFLNGNFFPVWADNSDITTNNPDGANKNFDIATAPVVVPTADISVVVTNSPSPVLSAGVLIYEIVVANNGPSRAGPVSVTNILASGLNFQSAVPALGGSYTVSGQTVIFTLPVLGVHSSVTNLIRVTATSSTYATNLTTVGSPLPDTVPTNNAFSLVTLIAGEDLALAMTESETNALVGDTITYFITVTNLGPSMNGNVIVTNVLSGNLQPYSVNYSQGAFTNYNNTLVFDLGVLGTNQSAAISVNATTLDAGTIATSIAYVSSEDVDTNLLNNSASVTATITGEDLALGMSSSPATTQTGLPITYFLTVTNFGPSTNEPVVIINELSTNLGQFTLTQFPSNTQYSITSNNLFVVDLPPLGLNQTESVAFTAVPAFAGTVTNLSAVGDTAFDTNFLNNGAIAVTTVTQAPPMIYSVHAMGYAGSALIVWTTDFPGTGQVDYGLTPGYGGVSWLNPALTNFHVVLLSGLIPGTNYYFNVLSQVNGVQYSSNGTFSTAATLILNTPDASYSGLWTASSQAKGVYCTPAACYYQYAATTEGDVTASATYRPNIAAAGSYGISIWHPQDAAFSTNTQILITGGTNELFTTVDETTNGGGWQTLATNFYMAAGSSNTLIILNNTGETNKSVVANAVRWSFDLSQDSPTNGSVPAWWANFFFGTNVAGSADADGDGYSNYAEYVFGTDPNDAASHLNMSVSLTGANTATVIFSPWVGGRVYQLQFTTDLTNPNWQTLTNVPTVDANGEGVFTVPQPGGFVSFYRLNAHF